MKKLVLVLSILLIIFLAGCTSGIGYISVESIVKNPSQYEGQKIELIGHISYNAITNFCLTNPRVSLSDNGYEITMTNITCAQANQIGDNYSCTGGTGWRATSDVIGIVKNGQLVYQSSKLYQCPQY